MNVSLKWPPRAERSGSIRIVDRRPVGQSPDRVIFRLADEDVDGFVATSIRVALVNDYMIVLEGLRSLLESSDPEIRIVELDVEKGPRRSVDVTLLDTYGEPQTLEERVHALGADPENGAIVVFSFSDRPQAVRRALRAAHRVYLQSRTSRSDHRRHQGGGEG